MIVRPRTRILASFGCPSLFASNAHARIAAGSLHRGYATSGELQRTALYDFHVKHGGKMVPFAGWEMPVQYANMGILQSHLHVREKAGLFDVSHMLQTKYTGRDRVKFLESLVVGDLEELPVGGATLSLFTNENGGIIDDTVIQKQADHMYVVSNAGTRDKDLAHIRKHLEVFKSKGGDVDMTIVDTSLVALQGPTASQVLSKLAGVDFSKFLFMSGKDLEIKGIPLHVSRCGYTGEDGFEISVPHDSVVKFTELLLDSEGGSVQLAGLGPRDSLRLEAGLCLYGHDIDDDTSPVEAALTWTIGKRRRTTLGFVGADKIVPQIKGGVSKKRVGLIVEGAPAREGAEVFSMDGTSVGKITSGGPSPCLKKNVAMAYLSSGVTKVGTDVQVKVRNKMQPAKVAKMPFVAPRRVMCWDAHASRH